ncbi:MAG: RNA pyrophosphohydrolase [Proteobacteria bacterium]|jgi:putative (di)nucleoside polyphosphate hydrolase|nr:RNA pyrophosphohydrolase [Pseudomonadota bacterium]
MIDKDGYRLNVGIILLNQNNQVFWGKRKGEGSWQFPQGGLYENEEIDQAMLRELNEELGLSPKHVTIIARTEKWLYYDVPNSYNRPNNKMYRGQKQIWYLLNFIGKDYDINVKSHKEQEFDAWRWINYWEPIDLVIKFKHDVYKQALQQLSSFLPNT